MRAEDKINLLNTVEVIDHDCSDGQCSAVWVDLKTPILEVMLKLGMKLPEVVNYVKAHVDVSDSLPYLNIVDLGFQTCEAGWFDGKQFLEECPIGE